MVQVSRELFDSIECDGAASGDHASAAREMARIATLGADAGELSRAEAFLRTGDEWLLADDPAEAADWYRRALADGGPASVDPRVGLARSYFQLGDTAAAVRLLAELKAGGRADPRTCDLAAELLVDRGDLAGALDWATAGVAQCLAAGHQPGGPQSELHLLLRLRWRIRHDLGLAEDEYDALLDAAR